MGKPRAAIGSSIAGVCVHLGIPYPVTGIIITGSPDVMHGGMPAATLGDLVATTCPICATGTITSGDSTYMIDGKPAASLGDMVTLGSGTIGTIVTATPNVQ